MRDEKQVYEVKKIKDFVGFKASKPRQGQIHFRGGERSTEPQFWAGVV